MRRARSERVQTRKLCARPGAGVQDKSWTRRSYRAESTTGANGFSAGSPRAGPLRSMIKRLHLAPRAVPRRGGVGVQAIELRRAVERAGALVHEVRELGVLPVDDLAALAIRAAREQPIVGDIRRRDVERREQDAHGDIAPVAGSRAHG